MKHNIFAIAIAAATTFSMSSAFAESGTINFTGEVISEGCDVVGSAQGPVSVDLGKISTKDLNGVGQKTTPKEFTIALTNCPTDLTASVRFDGEKDATDSNLLALSGTDAAEGVAIALMNADMTPLGLNQDSTETSLNADGNAELKFYAQYQATSSEIKSGPANSVANFTVAYK
ncbi:type 1 fimbrial protein [Enterobacter bugandensis]|uniref:fimbrial protein n=1 Tax=Enterobacter bugandensis TaxID=881260 RepID=UPI0023AF6523|nr:fimbrial protein [Enterobacter bugandensis]MDE7590859.1 type 1 fimbrial protein [Enterobacter bugandensis]